MSNSMHRNLNEYKVKDTKYTVKAMRIDGTEYTKECLNAISLMFALDFISNDITIVKNSIYVINTSQADTGETQCL